MKKQLLILLMLACSVTPVWAETVEDLFFGDDGTLTEREQQALKRVQDWRSGKTPGAKPVVTSDGSVQFFFGTSQPVISCAVLQVTDLSLEPGEKINSLHLGDSARWLIEPALTGGGESEVQHVIIKPIETDLKTSLIIATDRRSYHMVLKSYRYDYMPRVSFVYPDALMAKWNAAQKVEQKRMKKKIIEGTGQSIDELDFNYTISGDGKWVPVRVYNDGIRTIIEMPEKMKNDEAPSLMVIRASSGDEVMVNYRIHGKKYIVDTVFDEAVLLAGVGWSQEKITIKHEAN